MPGVRIWRTFGNGSAVIWPELLCLVLLFFTGGSSCCSELFVNSKLEGGQQKGVTPQNKEKSHRKLPTQRLLPAVCLWAREPEGDKCYTSTLFWVQLITDIYVFIEDGRVGDHLFCTHLFLQLSRSCGTLLCRVRFVQTERAVVTYPTTETRALSSHGAWRGNQFHGLVGHLCELFLKHVLKQTYTQ